MVAGLVFTEIKYEDANKSKAVTGAKPVVKLYSAEFDSRKTDLLDIVWAVEAKMTGKDDAGAPVWDVPSALDLVQVSDLDLKMTKLALKNFEQYLTDLLTFHKAGDRLAFVLKQLNTLTEAHLKDKESFEKGRFGLYFANMASPNVPVISYWPATSASPVFWFFKDALVKA